MAPEKGVSTVSSIFASYGLSVFDAKLLVVLWHRPILLPLITI
jgi:hypothetical protein